MAMSLHKLAAFGALLAIAPLTHGAVAPRQPVGEIVNASAETLNASNQPAPWTVDPPPRGTAAPGAQVASDTAHAGTQSLVLSANGASWINKTLVTPYATYKLTGWIRTQDVPAATDGGATILLRGVKTPSPAPRLSGTEDWTRVEATFETEGQDSVIVAATLGARGRGARRPRRHPERHGSTI